VRVARRPLLGRERDVAALDALRAREAIGLVTPIGRGGVGKTRLALELATRLRHAFADGCAGSKSIRVGPVPEVHAADRPLLPLES
jgi:hypothetical protein